MKTSTIPITRYVGKLCTLHPDQGGLRFKSNHRCVMCAALARAKWGVENADKHRASVDLYRSVNREKINTKRRVKSKTRAIQPDSVAPVEVHRPSDPVPVLARHRFVNPELKFLSDRIDEQADGPRPLSSTHRR